MAYPLFYYSLLNPAPLSAISATGFHAMMLWYDVSAGVSSPDGSCLLPP